MSRRFLLAYVAPVVALLLWTVAPLLRGSETLFLRDVFNTHLAMKAAQAQAMRQGHFPVLDPGRAGGQPLAGNPNAVAFHPDNLLYLVAPLLWAFNAHFWLHLLVAPFAMYSLGRAFGLDPPSAWAAGVTYALSGFFLSQLAFYNLVAGVALLPAFVAALLRLAEEARRPWWPAALLWTLLLVAGDPLVAAFALVLGTTAVGARCGRRPAGLAGVAAALLLGTLLAAPALVEFARILPLSFRGHWGYGGRSATVASFDPRQAAEWLLPLVFGRPDRLGPGGFWGHRFFTGVPAYYFSLYPGVVALGLLAAAGRPRQRAAWWAWGTAALGVFLALGRFNPLVAWVFTLPGAGMLRYPVKFWTLAAVGLALLCGMGFARLRDRGADPVPAPDPQRAARRFDLVAGGLGVVWLGSWVALTFLPGLTERALAGLMPSGTPESWITNERLRWAGLCLFSLLHLALVVAVWGRLRRGRAWGAPALLLLHAGSQLLFLRPLLATDAAAAYLEPPPALAHVAPRDVVVNGAAARFGPTTLSTAAYPDRRVRWLERRAFHDLYPVAGRFWGRRYELDTSPEGLDSFLARLAGEVMEQVGDRERLRLLRAWGVTRFLLDRDLEARALPLATLVARHPAFGEVLRVYAPRDPAPELLLARRVERAPHVNAAFSALARADFDPLTTVVVPGEGPPQAAAGGELRMLRRSAEGFTAETSAPEPTVLLWQRAHLDVYRAEIDGRPQPLVPANVYRVGLWVPAGRHTVRIAVERRPLLLAAWTALAAALVLVAAELRRRRAVRPRMLRTLG